MKILVWNCRGAGSKRFHGVIMDLLYLYKPDIVVLLETWVSGEKADKVVRGLGFPSSHRVEPQGYSGGIGVLWKSKDISVDVLQDDSQFVHMKVVQENNSSWLFTALYAKPMESMKAWLWQQLLQMSHEISVPWMLAGDFNEIASVDEKSGGAPASYSRCRKFKDWIEECKLIDLGYLGPKFTWRGQKSPGLSRVYERLDRAFCNMEWRVSFPEAAVRNLPRVKSDHHPILIDLQSNLPPPAFQRPFRFEAAWLTHKEFGEFVKKNWNGGAKLVPE